MSTTIDKFLDGKIHIAQPQEGYRAGADPVFLAASIPAEENHMILDVGAGVGTAMLCLAARVPGCRVVGLEMQRDLVRLANHNIQMNHFQNRLDILQGDLQVPPPRLAASSFTHVMSNPPYFAKDQVTKSPITSKALSNVESTSSLKSWVDFCVRMVQPKGTVTFIYTADRLDDLMLHASERLSELVLFPLWPKENRAAKRFLLRGRKNVEKPMTIASGLVLHDESGAYSQSAQAILRAGKSLELL
jgi:tRNA1(Val) A37 N6-methylase TrmN6